MTNHFKFVVKPLKYILFKEAPNDIRIICGFKEKSPLHHMQSVSYLFVKQPGKDFSRIRKVSFADAIHFLLTMNGNTLRREWMAFWDFQPDMASFPAFLQRRQKLLPDSMDFLFYSFNNSFSSMQTYRGYRLLACDGSDLTIAHNQKDNDTHRRHNPLERNEGLRFHLGCL